jgi:hypothetical protein
MSILTPCAYSKSLTSDLNIMCITEANIILNFNQCHTDLNLHLLGLAFRF